MRHIKNGPRVTLKALLRVPVKGPKAYIRCFLLGQ